MGIARRYRWQDAATGAPSCPPGRCAPREGGAVRHGGRLRVATLTRVWTAPERAGVELGGATGTDNSGEATVILNEASVRDQDATGEHGAGFCRTSP